MANRKYDVLDQMAPLVMVMLFLGAIGCTLLMVYLNLWGNRPDLTPFLKVVAIVTAILGGASGVFGVLRS
jgi:hypothetical protein